MDNLISPHGGALVDLLVDAVEAVELRRRSSSWPSLTLTPRQLCDLELLVTGAFSPLRGFLGEKDHESVLATMRLAAGAAAGAASTGVLWPVPVTLDPPDGLAGSLEPGSRVALRDPEGVMLAVLDVEELWRPDATAEAEAVLGTADPGHPGVADLLASPSWRVAGVLHGVQLPAHPDFAALRQPPAAVRADMAARGLERVVAFHARGPMHRPHQETARRAAEATGAHLLVHTMAGPVLPGQLDHFVTVRCNRAALAGFAAGSATLALLPLAQRPRGPRELLWRALVARNFGCTHLVADGDDPGAEAGVDLAHRHQDELGTVVVPGPPLVYAEDRRRWVPQAELPAGAGARPLPAPELRRLLDGGARIPEWFTSPEIARELRRAHPPRSEQGVTVFFTGLSGSGKSTIANLLHARLCERGDRRVTLLDGDLVRRHLSSELGFSREHRDLNVRRIGFVAAEITRHGGVAVCAPIAPYDATRKHVRAMAEAAGGFVLVHVATPLAVCEQRDRKGLYAKARAGLIPEFTGISDPYEEPADAELVIDASTVPVEEAAGLVLSHLERGGWLPPEP